MERILDIELTPKEKERADQLRKQHKTRGFLYMIEESVNDVGENCVQIIWSPTQVEDCGSTDKVEIHNITDMPESDQEYEDLINHIEDLLKNGTPEEDILVFHNRW